MMNYVKNKRLIFSPFPWVLAICLLASFHAPARSDEEQPKVEIESEPEDFAADLLIAYAAGKMPSEEEREQERKRTRFGAGEIVKLKLSGKKALIGNPKTLKWTIEEGKGNQWATIETKENNPNLLVDVALAIKPDLVFEPSEPKDPENELGDTPFQTEGSINVQVFQQKDGEKTLIAEKEFTAVLPNKITAEHEGRPISAQDDEEEGAKFAKDGDWDPVGASAVLKLTYHPTDVSFHKLAKIEVDHGFKRKGQNLHLIPPELLDVHMPTATAKLISEQNGSIDYIGTRKSVAKMNGALPWLSVGFTWICGFYTAPKGGGADKRLARIGIYEQKFLFDDKKTKDVKHVETSISKFKCTVSRVPGGKHLFTQEQ